MLYNLACLNLMRHRKDFERKLQKELELRHYLVFRVAGSGVRSTAHCDLIVFPPDINIPMLVEVKTTSQALWKFKYQTRQVREEIEWLKHHSRLYGLKGVLAVKFMRKSWIFIDVQRVDESFELRPEDRGDFDLLRDSNN